MSALYPAEERHLKRGKHPNSRKRSRRPRWLVLGALAASASLTGRLALNAFGREPDLAKPALAALMDEAWVGRLAPGQTTGMAALRFDIPAGPLGPALDAFESVSGLRIEIEDEEIRGLDSPGVSGLLTPDQALAALLEGTGVDFQLTSSRTARLDRRLAQPGEQDPAPRGRALRDLRGGQGRAGHQSAKAKNNQQLPEDSAAARELGQMIVAMLQRNPMFLTAALPLQVFPPLFNRYQGGQSFGTHVDNSIRQLTGTPHRIRTDISATLFLAGPEEYDGGE